MDELINKVEFDKEFSLKGSCLLDFRILSQWLAVFSISLLSFLPSSVMAQVASMPPAATQLQPLTALFQSTDFSAMVRSYRVDDTLGTGLSQASESSFKALVREAARLLSLLLLLLSFAASLAACFARRRLPTRIASCSIFPGYCVFSPRERVTGCVARKARLPP